MDASEEETDAADGRQPRADTRVLCHELENGAGDETEASEGHRHVVKEGPIHTRNQSGIMISVPTEYPRLALFPPEIYRRTETVVLERIHAWWFSGS
jgi:hypothetical protein